MPNALIVDDSKTARYALRQLLDKQQISCDMVESAEQALDYLQEQRPDLIFMDHMMPGMDGFEAVKLIKADPAIRDIPIIMYTSTQGGVYFGQARALGAADVIAKPATTQELQDVLRRLREPRRNSVTPGRAVATATLVETTSSGKDEPITPVAAIAAPEMTDSSDPTWLAPATPTAPASPPMTGRSGRGSGWWLAAPGVLVALVLALLYIDSVADRSQLQQQRAAALDALQWAVSGAEYPYGEPPFGGNRLVQLQELLVHLQSIGFEGTVRLEGHVGEFCLVRPNDGSDGGRWVPATGNMAITECGALGQSQEESGRLSRETAPAMRRFLKGSPLLASGRLAVELVPRGATEPVVAYPTSATVSADVWNAAAQHNNRVTFELVPHDR